MFLFDDLIHLRKKNVVGFLLNRKKLYFQIMDFKLVLRIFFYLILFKLANSVYQVKCGVKVTPV
jgi:hypothetical protein